MQLASYSHCISSSFVFRTQAPNEEKHNGSYWKISSRHIHRKFRLFSIWMVRLRGSRSVRTTQTTNAEAHLSLRKRSIPNEDRST